MKFNFVYVLAALILLIAGAMWLNLRFFSAPAEPNKPIVLVTIPPQKNLVSTVAGDTVIVNQIIPAGANPESYELRPSDLLAVADAELYFTVGKYEFEQKNSARFQEINPNLKIVDTSKNVVYRKLSHHHHHEDGRHGEAEAEHQGETDDQDETKHQDTLNSQVMAAPQNEETHSDEESSLIDDPHTWLSPQNAKLQVIEITQALSEKFPENKDLYQTNSAALIAEIEQLDQTISTQLAAYTGTYVLVYHAAFGYLLDEYGLVQLAIEVGNKEPTFAQLQETLTAVKANQVGAVFVQPQFSQQSASVIAAELGVPVVTLDPYAENYLENLRQIGQHLADTL